MGKRITLRGMLGKLTFIIYDDMPVIQVADRPGNAIDFMGRDDMRKLYKELDKMFGDEK